MDELTRFARRLVEQLAASPEGVDRPVPISSVRDKILPYRAHRKSLMLDSVEDYETVLLRLAAGERGFVRTLPTSAARRCQDELAGANPDLSVLDEIAGATLQITSLAAAQIVADGEEPAPPEPKRSALRFDRAAAAAAAAAPPVAAAPEPAPAPPPPVAAAPESAPVTSAAAAPGAPEPARPEVRQAACPDCQQQTPPGLQVVFCPWCGKRLVPFTCERCQTELDSAWRHCITCGSPVKDPFHFT
jgi:hypothetical protein